MTTPSNPTNPIANLQGNTLLRERPASLATNDTEVAIDGLEMRWSNEVNQPKSVLLGSSPVKIGTAPKCEIRLTGTGLKPLHAVVSSTEEGFIIRRWGFETSLNGEDFQESLLTSGDTLTIGTKDHNAIEIKVSEIDRSETDTSTVIKPEEDFQDAHLEENFSSESLIAIESTVCENLTEEPRDEAKHEVSCGLLPTNSYEVVTEKFAEEFDQHSAVEIVNDVWAIEIDSHQETQVDANDFSAKDKDSDLAQNTAETTETRVKATVLEEVGPAESPASKFDSVADQDAISQFIEDDSNNSQPIRVEGTSQVSRERLTHNYLRVKRLVRSLKAERIQLAETNHKIELFAEQLDRLHQQMTDSAAENDLLNERIAELEMHLEAAYADQEFSPEDSQISENSEQEVAIPLAHQESPLANLDDASHLAPQSLDSSEDLSFEKPSETHSNEILSKVNPNELWALEQLAVSEPDQEDAQDYAEVDSDSEDHAKAEADVALPVGSLLAEFQQEEVNQVGDSEENLTEKPSESNDPYQPASFIEQFSHLVPEDDSETEKLSFPAEEPMVSSELQTVMPSVEASTESDESDEDESVDDYMAKMMARIRGDVSPESTTSSSSKPSAKPMAVSAKASVTEDREESSTPKGPPITNLSQLKGSDAPEINTDMAALRSLANTSARDAIELARSRQWREKVTSKIGVIGLGFGGSVIGMITSPNLFGFQFLLSACFATMWSYIGLKSLLKAQADATLDADLSVNSVDLTS